MPDLSPAPDHTATTQRPTCFADITRLVAAIAQVAPLPPVPDDFKTAIYADPQLAAYGQQREALVWLAQGQRRFPPQLGRSGQVGIALYAGPHASNAIDWPALLSPWNAGTAPPLHILQTDPAVDLDLYELADAPIADSRHGPALTEAQAAHAMAYGMLAAKPDLTLLALSSIGDSATGADTSALAVMAALLRLDAAAITTAPAQMDAIDSILTNNRAALTDPLTIIATLGGHDSCAILGAILAARLAGYPILLEGLPALAAAMTLAKLAGTIAQARDLLGHVRVTSIPTHLQSSLSPNIQSLNGFALAGPTGDGQQIAMVLPELRRLTG